MLLKCLTRQFVKCSQEMKASLRNGSKRNAFLLHYIAIFLIFCCCDLEAQIIYDSPPVGISITRPVLPWLARYFVNAGNKKVYFLDEPQKGPSEEVEENQIAQGGANHLDGAISTGQQGAATPQQSVNQLQTPQHNMANPIIGNNFMTAEAPMMNELATIPTNMQNINMHASQLGQPQNAVNPATISALNNPPAAIQQQPLGTPTDQFPIQSASPMPIADSGTATALGPAQSPPLNNIAEPLTDCPTIIPITVPTATPLFPCACSPPLLALSELPEPLPIIPECHPIPATELLPNSQIFNPLPTINQARLKFQPISRFVSMIMNGSPKPSNPNFSYKDAILTGATPPTVQLPPSKFLATLRRFTG